MIARMALSPPTSWAWPRPNPSSENATCWDNPKRAQGQNIIEHLAGVEGFEVAEAAYRAAVKRWPRAAITLRAGARVIHDSRRQ